MMMKNEQRTAADDNRVVFHEAGHATIGRFLHATPLGGCTAEPGEDYSGLCWGALYDRRLKFSEAQAEAVPNLCRQLSGEIPATGESRAEWADVYLHCFHQIVELCAGTEAERLFVDGEPLFAVDDEAKAFQYASLITSSPEAAEAMIAACRAESAALLKAQSHIICAIACELRTKRTLDGAMIDSVIEAAVAAHGLDIERGRRVEWQTRQRNAAEFLKGLTSNGPTGA
jgi:hypothetical protein